MCIPPKHSFHLPIYSQHSRPPSPSNDHLMLLSSPVCTPASCRRTRRTLQANRCHGRRSLGQPSPQAHIRRSLGQALPRPALPRPRMAYFYLFPMVVQTLMSSSEPYQFDFNLFPSIGFFYLLNYYPPIGFPLDLLSL